MLGLLWEKSPPEIVVLVTHCVLALEFILLPLSALSTPVGPPYSTLHISLESREKLTPVADSVAICSNCNNVCLNHPVNSM